MCPTLASEQLHHASSAGSPEGTSFCSAGGAPGLAHPVGLPTGLLGHPTEPDPAAKGSVPGSLPTAPLGQPHASGQSRGSAGHCSKSSPEGCDKAEQMNQGSSLVEPMRKNTRRSPVQVPGVV